jgi:peptidoglycan hydrolase-like protein with peptidoglycan-binding domain
LIGTAIGAALQGYWNVEVERQQFESNLIIKLLEGKADEKQRAKNLLFLLDADLVSTLDERKIRELADDPGRLPIILPSVTLTVREAKALLRAHGFYSGEINDAADNAFRDAIIKFQESQGFAIDGLLGSITAEALINFVPQQSK